MLTVGQTAQILLDIQQLKKHTVKCMGLIAPCLLIQEQVSLNPVKKMNMLLGNNNMILLWQDMRA